jgi:hypothetical protein
MVRTTCGDDLPVKKIFGHRELSTSIFGGFASATLILANATKVRVDWRLKFNARSAQGAAGEVWRK